MTEGFNHIASDQELETAAIAGAAAVERLITERNNFRTELAASKAAQEELRRRFGLLHRRYIELARKVVSELHQFDSLMRDAIGEKAEVINDEAESTGPNRQFDNAGLPQPQSSPQNGNGTAQARGPASARSLGFVSVSCVLNCPGQMHALEPLANRALA